MPTRNPWLVAADVCRVLGYKKSTTAVVGQHCRPKGCTKMVLPSAGGQQSTILINEGSGATLAGSRRRRFAQELAHELVTALRGAAAYLVAHASENVSIC